MADKAPVQLLPAYLIVGADELKSKQAVTRLKARLEPGFEVFNTDERTASSEIVPGDLLASLRTYAVGSGFRLVLIDRADKLPKPVSEAIIEYLKEPNPSCVLCLVATTLAKTTRLRKAVAALGKHSVIDCTPKKRWELAPSVVKMAASHGINMDEHAAAELISRVGESTTMLDAQVKTLADLCRSAGVITVTDVEKRIVRTAEVKPWDFLDAVCMRDGRRAMELYGLLQKPSQISLLSLIVGRLRELICAKSLEARGELGALAATLEKQQWQVKNYGAWSRRFGEGELEAALVRCAECERKLKGGSNQDIEFVRLVLSICK